MEQGNRKRAIILLAAGIILMIVAAILFITFNPQSGQNPAQSPARGSNLEFDFPGAFPGGEARTIGGIWGTYHLNGWHSA